MIGILKKDLLLFVRDKKNLLLVILTPIIIMTILGNVFSGTSKEEFLKNIKLGYCSDDAEFKLNYPFTLMTYEENCVDKINTSVVNGKMRGALHIPVTFSANIKDGFGSELVLYIDNAKPQTSLAVTTAMQALVNVMNEEIGVTFIQEAWKNLKDLDKSLSYAAEQMETTKLAAMELELRARNIYATVEIINVSVAYDYLQKAEEQINTIPEKITKPTIHEINITPANEMLDKISAIPGIEQNITDIYETICNARYENYTVPADVCIKLNETKIDLNLVREQQNYGIDYLKKELENITQLINDNLEKTNIALNSAEEKLLAVSENLINMDSSITKIREQIKTVEDAQTNAKNKLNEIVEITHNYTEQISMLQNRLNTTAQFLAVYTKRDPRNIVRAVTLKINESNVGKKQFSFMAPGILVIVLMLITFLISSAAIVAERKSGTMMRNMLSPVSLEILLLEKVVYLMILCIVQVILMLGVNVFFDVIFPFSFQLIGIILLIALTLVTTGMFLGALSKSENTALLSSLVVSIPLMFLAGVFFPFESMPKEMALIGTYSLITMGVSLMESVVTYAIMPNTSYIGGLLGLSLMFFGLTYFLVKRTPTIE